MRHLPAGRRTVGLTVMAAGLLLLTACHGMAGSAAGPPVHATLTVTAPPGVPDAPLYIGIRDRLFKAAGLTIRLRPAASVKTEVSRLESGAAGVAFTDYADLFSANEQHPSPHLVIVADGYDCAPNVMEVLALPSSHINSALDLAGKRIGTPLPQEQAPSSSRPYSLETTATWAALNNDGVDPSGIRWDPMPASDLTAALQSHQVDAILVTEPTITETETQLGAVPVLDSCSGPTANLPLDGYATTAAFASKHRAVLNAFRSALARAQAAASTSAPVQAALESYAQMDKQTAALVTVGTYPTTLVPANIQRLADIMFRFNALSTPVTVSQVIAP